MKSNLDLLTQINLDDLVASFGWENRPLLARTLRGPFLHPAQDFAADMADFDHAVGSRGLADAARGMLRGYTRDVRVFGLENIPIFRDTATPETSTPRHSTPFLALSNHPGMADTLALFSALNRADLKIIALDRPFLNALPETSKQLFYLKDDPAARITLVRQVSAHLRAGGAVLTFPAGRIEPDPDLRADAAASLDNWTDSVGVFLRLAPETAILPVLVRGVLREKSTRHPLLKLKKSREEREKLAAALQLLAHVVFKQADVRIRVQIGKPIYVKNLGSTETQVIHQAVLAEMRRLIENPPQAEGVSTI